MDDRDRKAGGSRNPGQGPMPYLEGSESVRKQGEAGQVVAKGRHDFAFTSLGKAMGHASTLDLKAKIQEIWTDYIMEFPPDMVPTDVRGAMVDTKAQSSEHDVEIQASAES